MMCILLSCHRALGKSLVGQLVHLACMTLPHKYLMQSCRKHPMPNFVPLCILVNVPVFNVVAATGQEHSGPCPDSPLAFVRKDITEFPFLTQEPAMANDSQYRLPSHPLVPLLLNALNLRVTGRPWLHRRLEELYAANCSDEAGPSVAEVPVFGIRDPSSFIGSDVAL